MHGPSWGEESEEDSDADAAVARLAGAQEETEGERGSPGVRRRARPREV
jgi:hypothetical protein